MTDSLHANFSHLDCTADFWSLRVVDERAENYCVRKNVPQPPSMSLDRGAMLTVYAGGGYGYAATSDLSRGGLRLDHTIPLPVGTVVNLTFTLPGDSSPVKITGEIVSNAGPEILRMGVKFVNPSTEAREKIDAYLARVGVSV